uniref:hypothetical protein n=1 Tax=Escherichia coli TaxID=562 RepID=UPI0020357953|nr:hypothetical protein [Escherichia coli]
MYKFTPVQIIADYILRFLKNNADAKLYEAMQRLETKIGQFIADGVDEHQLRSSLSKASRSRSGRLLYRSVRNLFRKKSIIRESYFNDKWLPSYRFKLTAIPTKAIIKLD